jgi:hypothetical protein
MLRCFSAVSLSQERDTALMNCEFFGTEEDQVMVTFIHLQFLNTEMEFILQVFFGLGIPPAYSWQVRHADSTSHLE